jgi:hypothetical protein
MELCIVGFREEVVKQQCEIHKGDASMRSNKLKVYVFESIVQCITANAFDQWAGAMGWHFFYFFIYF